MLKGISWQRVGIFTLVALLLFFGGQVLYEHFVVKQALNQAIASIAPEGEVQYRKDGAWTIVEISPGQWVDLADGYRQVLQLSREQFGPNIQVEVHDLPNPELELVWAELQFPVFQGIATGDFIRMKAEADGLFSGMTGLQGKISLDKENVYVQLKKGDSYLYRIIPRENRGEPR
ncbi:MAG: hypothetical protein PHC60_05805 [Heliobacteriaceae bacterium]|nr:hypothetical protein [Heliobacteriaceae bacterium]MDD4587879.1 hypothetical protein [Heliobacteriaceae bacterium]